MNRRRALALAALVIATQLTGCSAGTSGDGAGAPEPATASGHPAGSTTAPVDAAQVGTCTQEEVGDSLGPMVFTVATDTDNIPIQLSYPAFNSDGTVETITETATGPVIVRISYPCSASALSALWVAEATAVTPEHLSCTLSNGGNLIATEQRWHHDVLDTLDVLCQGHAA